MRKDNLLAYELQMQMKTSENCISFSRAHSISVCLCVWVGAVCVEEGGTCVPCKSRRDIYKWFLVIKLTQNVTLSLPQIFKRHTHTRTHPHLYPLWKTDSKSRPSTKGTMQRSPQRDRQLGQRRWGRGCAKKTSPQFGKRIVTFFT